MDQSAVRAIVDEQLAGLMRALGIPHWKIRVAYGPTSSDQCPGEVERLPEYEKAYIALDPQQLDDADEVKEVLRHELFHVMLSPFLLYRQDRTATIPSGSSDDERERRLWRDCEERAILNMERMWSGMLENVCKGQADGRADENGRLHDHDPGEGPEPQRSRLR